MVTLVGASHPNRHRCRIPGRRQFSCSLFDSDAYTKVINLNWHKGCLSGLDTSRDTTVKPQSMSAPLALWLDPESPLTAPHARVLSDTGWVYLGVETLQGVLQHAGHAAVLVFRLQTDVSQLAALQQALTEAGLQTPIVCRVLRQDLELAVAASQAGAIAVVADDDVRPETWLGILQKLSQPVPSPTQPATNIRSVVFVDPVSQHLLALARKVAQADVTALLVGPTGAGKEVLARVLHEASPRAHQPFVALNCAAIPENLIEDMLFGHEKGAFTGAHRDHKGVFEQAQGGTLFLDEIGEMPMHLQSKLLRVLQERQLTRLGGQTLIPLNVRFIAATNKDLRHAIAQREFREDLYYRIATFRLTLQPLRERPGDIIPLALHSLNQTAQAGRPWQIHAQAQTQLLQYPWPGNVRELENVMRRAMVLCPDRIVMPEHLMFDEACMSLTTEVQTNVPPAVLPTPSWSEPARAPVGFAAAESPVSAATPVSSTWAVEVVDTTPAPAQPQDLHSAARLNEHQIIMATLATTPNKTEAAKRLGISPRTLRYKLAQLREMGLGLATAS